MNFKLTTKAVFTALLAVMVIGIGAVVGAHYGWHLSNPAMIAMGLAVPVIFGTATVIQTFPLAATFPTSAQAVNVNTQISRVVMADTDTLATLTHNWLLTAAQLAQFLPLISWYVENPGVSYPVVSFALTDSNTVTMAKTVATGSGGTYVVSLFRPYSATL